MYLKQIAILLLIGLLAACAKPDRYKAPPGVTPESGAIILGSIERFSDLLTKNRRTYIVGIDGKLTRAGPRGWGKKLLLVEGVHKIKLGVSDGDGFGFTKEFLIGPVRRGEVFIARSAKVANRLARAWIMKKDGSQVTEKFTVKLSKGKPPFTPIILVR
jgi:hypothetical protein